MKNTFCLVVGVMLSTSLLAQPEPNAPPPAPAPNPPPPAAAPGPPVASPAGAKPKAPAAKAPKKKKSAPKKKAVKKAPVAKKAPTAAELRTVPLVPGPAVVTVNHLNVRGQAKLRSEVVARLNKNDSVTVVEEITRAHSGPEEPSAWAKILLPVSTHVWVSTLYVDPATKTVKPRRLNLRSGPGENYSVLGRIERGQTVQELSTKGDWLEIEPPTNAYAFVAAQYLSQEAPAAPTVTPAAPPPPAPPIATVTEPTPPPPPPPPPTPTTVSAPPSVASAPTEPPITAAPVPPEPAVPSTPAPEVAAVTPPPPAPPVDEPPPKRIVEREGIVRSTFSIQAPTRFELISPQTRASIDYLYTTSTNLDLARYKGLRVVVTGEEGLEERWGNTPVITIQKIQVMDEFEPLKF